MKFNLKEFTKSAIAIPNGTSVSEIPTGDNMGDGVLLNPGSTGAEGDVQKEPLKNIIGEILKLKSENADPAEIQRVAKKAIHADIPPEVVSQNEDVARLVVALGRRADEDQSAPVINPSTGEQERTLGEIAEEIAAAAGWDMEELISGTEDQTAPGGMPPMSAPVTASVKTAQEWADPLKKKKRGNPFRVLMGKVQKMMDHGFKGNDIVRKVLKLPGNKWKRETVVKCVSVVEDYQKRKTRRKGEGSEEKKSGMTFNLARYAQTKQETEERSTVGFKPGALKTTEKRESLYDIPRDIKLMSTTELIIRLAYLIGARDFDGIRMNENGFATLTDKTQTRKDVEQIRRELVARKYTRDEIGNLSESLCGRQPQLM